MYRKGPDKWGAYHWVISHPTAKLLLGRASGRRQFSERAHGGEQATRSLAQQTLDLWKEEAERELRNTRHMKLCLCDSQDCQQKRSREVGRAIKHVSSWKLVHEHSVEHQLAFASTTGSKIAAKRQTIIATKSGKIARLAHDEGAAVVDAASQQRDHQ